MKPRKTKAKDKTPKMKKTRSRSTAQSKTRSPSSTRRTTRTQSKARSTTRSQSTTRNTTHKKDEKKMEKTNKKTGISKTGNTYPKLHNDDEHEIFNEFQNIIEQISDEFIKQKLHDMFTIIMTEMVENQAELKEKKKEIETLIPRMNEMNLDIAGMQKKIQSDKEARENLLSEGEEQINELNNKISDQITEIKRLQKQIKTMNTNTEEYKEIMKSMDDENQGLKLTIQSMKNTIEQIKQKSHCNKYYSTTLIEYDNSIDISNMDNDISNRYNEQNEMVNRTKTLQEELELESFNNIEENVESNNKTHQQQNEKSEDNVRSGDQGDYQEIESEENNEEHSISYFTPDIIIANNEELQKELENNGIINKRKENTKNRSNYEDIVNEKYGEQEEELGINEIMNIRRENTDEENIKDNQEINERSGNNEEYNQRLNELERKIMNNTAKIKEIEKSFYQQQKKHVDIYMIGDSHIRNMKYTIKKYLPNNKYTVEESYIPGAKYNDISTKCLDGVDSCDHLIVMCGTNDIFKSKIETMKSSIDKICEKYKSCQKIHMILVPDRYDDIQINYHIKIVNEKIVEHTKKYKNLIVYDTKKITENWDYSDGIHFGRNGKIKICKEIIKNITSKKHTNEYTNNEHMNAYDSDQKTMSKSHVNMRYKPEEIRKLEMKTNWKNNNREQYIQNMKYGQEDTYNKNKHLIKQNQKFATKIYYTKEHNIHQGNERKTTNQLGTYNQRNPYHNKYNINTYHNDHTGNRYEPKYNNNNNHKNDSRYWYNNRYRYDLKSKPYNMYQSPTEYENRNDIQLNQWPPEMNNIYQSYHAKPWDFQKAKPWNNGNFQKAINAAVRI